MKKAGIYILMVMALVSCKKETEEQLIYELPGAFEIDDYTEIAAVQPEQVQEDTPESSRQIFDLELTNLDANLAAEDQKVIFSFKTASGKTLSLLTDQEENYLVYRFGTPNNVELQYPNPVTSDSWEKFRFEGYKTPSLYLMHVIFDNSGTKYIIYYNKFAKSPQQNKIGVQVVLGDKRKDIRGRMSSLKGTLEYFRSNDKILKTW